MWKAIGAADTARSRIERLVDPGTFVEYGPMALAAQRRRRTREDLIQKSPADGLITGVGAVNGRLFGEPDNRCAEMIYDYTVFAGTQGLVNHHKKDRMFDIAERSKLPVVFFAEGGGGRLWASRKTGTLTEAIMTEIGRAHV